MSHSRLLTTIVRILNAGASRNGTQATTDRAAPIRPLSSAGVNDTTIVAVAGILGTLVGAVVGPIITARLGNRNERRARLRDARTTLYVDINIATSAAERFINSVTDRDRRREPSRARKPEGWETLDARIYLLASDELRTAWRESIKDIERLEWSVFEEGGLGPNPESGYLNDDDPLVFAARSSVQRVFALTRAAAARA